MVEVINTALSSDASDNVITLLGAANHTLIPLLDKVGLSWPTELGKIASITGKNGTNITSDEYFYIGYQRLILRVSLSIFAVRVLPLLPIEKIPNFWTV